MRIDQSQPETHQALSLRTSVERSGASDIPAARQVVPPELIASDDLMPGQTAQRLVEWSTAKSPLSAERLIVLGLMAGAFIAIGGAFFTGVMSVSSLTHGPSRLLGGIVFSCGLLLICVSGAELSTGNCMLFTAGLSPAHARRRGPQSCHFVCCQRRRRAGVRRVVARSGLLQSGHGHTAAAIAETKMNLSFEQAFVRGILCNALVCIAVWMILAARTIPSKLAGLIFPISAIITLGFEHSIANFYLLPAGLLAGAAGSLGAAVTNLVAVTFGNLIGGIGVALALWMAYLRGTDSEPARATPWGPAVNNPITLRRGK
jgi:formate/nitrite transporter FocA (FNT family)